MPQDFNARGKKARTATPYSSVRLRTCDLTLAGVHERQWLAPALNLAHAASGVFDRDQSRCQGGAHVGWHDPKVRVVAEVVVEAHTEAQDAVWRHIEQQAVLIGAGSLGEVRRLLVHKAASSESEAPPLFVLGVLEQNVPQHLKIGMPRRIRSELVTEEIETCLENALEDVREIRLKRHSYSLIAWFELRPWLDERRRLKQQVQKPHSAFDVGCAQIKAAAMVEGEPRREDRIGPVVPR